VFSPCHLLRPIRGTLGKASLHSLAAKEETPRASFEGRHSFRFGFASQPGLRNPQCAGHRRKIEKLAAHVRASIYGPLWRRHAKTLVRYLRVFLRVFLRTGFVPVGLCSDSR
jgi:hypothetical protein